MTAMSWAAVEQASVRVGLGPQVAAEMRVFAIDNIERLDVLSATFVRPRDFNVEAFGAHSVSGVRHAVDLVEVTIRFSPIVAKAAAASDIARDRHVTPGEDGSVEIRYRVAEPLEIVRWSFGWGTEAEVVGPPTAREAATALARALAARYEGAT